MNTIRDYLDNMFLALPKNDNTRRAKEELLSMMEDKYLELKENGKIENEAIGIVISEFGSLEEVSEILGIEEIDFENNSPIKEVTLDDAKSYIKDVKKYFPKVALGIGITISSLAAFIFVLGLYELNILQLSESKTSLLALIMMFSIVAVGVYFIISNYSELSAYKYLIENPIHLDYQTRQEINFMKSEVTPRYKRALSLSVVSYILSVMPIFISLVLFGDDNDGAVLLSVSICILIVALASYHLILNYAIYDGVNKLLREGEYKNYNLKDHEKADRIASIYWSIIVALYLAYSFITDDWGRSWIIWPVAGVIYGGVSAFMNI